MSQMTPTLDKALNKRQKDYVHNLIYLEMPPCEAFRAAGYSSVGASTNAKKMLNKTYVNRYYREQLEKRAKELQEQRNVVSLAVIINQQTQVEKLEALRVKAEQTQDFSAALGCIREEDKVFGLVKDIPSADAKEAEIDAAIREQAAKLNAADFLAIPPQGSPQS